MSKIIEAMNWRYATKRFDSSKKISESDFNEILEVLRLAPSSFGLQPWKFIIGFRKGSSKEQIVEWNKKQVYIALGILLQSAAMKNIDSCPMEGFNPKAIDEILNLNKENPLLQFYAHWDTAQKKTVMHQLKKQDSQKIK